MKDMGFDNIEINKAMLQQNKGDVEKAMEAILNS